MFQDIEIAVITRAENIAVQVERACGEATGTGEVSIARIVLLEAFKQWIEDCRIRI
jgi:hypothetical protein